MHAGYYYVYHNVTYAVAMSCLVSNYNVMGKTLLLYCYPIHYLCHIMWHVIDVLQMQSSPESTKSVTGTLTSPPPSLSSSTPSLNDAVVQCTDQPEDHQLQQGMLMSTHSVPTILKPFIVNHNRKWQWYSTECLTWPSTPTFKTTQRR